MTGSRAPQNTGKADMVSEPSMVTNAASSPRRSDLHSLHRTLWLRASSEQTAVRSPKTQTYLHKQHNTIALRLGSTVVLLSLLIIGFINNAAPPQVVRLVAFDRAEVRSVRGTLMTALIMWS